MGQKQMSATLALQIALRERLTSATAVTDLVPADAILDRNQRPAPLPSVILGEGQTVEEGSDKERRRLRIYHTVHVWNREPGLAGVQEIASNIREALNWKRLQLQAPWNAVTARVSSIRAMRDPDGETAHAVITIAALISEVMP